MPWTPQLAAVDVRSIVGNLISFFETHQVDALAWASPDRELEALHLYPTAEVRALTDFPHMGVVERRVRIEDEESSKVVTLELTLEFEIAAEHTKEGRTEALAQLAADVDAVGYAFESMTLNAPTASVYGAGVHEIFRTVTSIVPLEAAVSDTKSMFNTQLRAVFQFRRPIY